MQDLFASKVLYSLLAWYKYTDVALVCSFLGKRNKYITLNIKENRLYENEKSTCTMLIISCLRYLIQNVIYSTLITFITMWFKVDNILSHMIHVSVSFH